MSLNKQIQDPMGEIKIPSTILDADARIHLRSFHWATYWSTCWCHFGSCLCHLGCRHWMPFWTNILSTILEADSGCHFGRRCWVPSWKHILEVILEQMLTVILESVAGYHCWSRYSQTRSQYLNPHDWKPCFVLHWYHLRGFLRMEILSHFLMYSCWADLNRLESKSKDCFMPPLEASCQSQEKMHLFSTGPSNGPKMRCSHALLAILPTPCKTLKISLPSSCQNPPAAWLGSCQCDL